MAPIVGTVGARSGSWKTLTLSLCLSPASVFFGFFDFFYVCPSPCPVLAMTGGGEKNFSNQDTLQGVIRIPQLTLWVRLRPRLSEIMSCLTSSCSSSCLVISSGAECFLNQPLASGFLSGSVPRETDT